MMTARDYNSLAAAIYHGYTTYNDRITAVRVLESALAAANSRFDVDRFASYATHGYPVRYVVSVNVPGYLPMADPDYCQTLGEARTVAADHARELRDQYGYAAVRGSAVAGWYIVDDGRAGLVVNIDPADYGYNV